jgi:hypothetical protein
MLDADHHQASESEKQAEGGVRHRRALTARLGSREAAGAMRAGELILMSGDEMWTFEGQVVLASALES